jgi:hypothetical protein
VLQVLALQALNVAPDSLLLLDLAAGADAATAGASAAAADASSSDALLLAVGLANGVLLRTEVDRVTGQLSDPRRRVLGHKPPRLAGIALRGRRAMLALSSRPWLGCGEAGGRFALSPLSYDHLIAAAPFHSEAVGEGVVALARDATLRVFAVEASSGAAFNATTLPLRYTPRALAAHPTRPLLAVVEADAGVLAPAPGAARDAHVADARVAAARAGALGKGAHGPRSSARVEQRERLARSAQHGRLGARHCERIAQPGERSSHLRGAHASRERVQRLRAAGVAQLGGCAGEEHEAQRGVQLRLARLRRAALVAQRLQPLRRAGAGERRRRRGRRGRRRL